MSAIAYDCAASGSQRRLYYQGVVTYTSDLWKHLQLGSKSNQTLTTIFKGGSYKPNNLYCNILHFEPLLFKGLKCKWWSNQRLIKIVESQILPWLDVYYTLHTVYVHPGLIPKLPFNTPWRRVWERDYVHPSLKLMNNMTYHISLFMLVLILTCMNINQFLIHLSSLHKIQSYMSNLYAWLLTLIHVNGSLMWGRVY